MPGFPLELDFDPKMHRFSWGRALKSQFINELLLKHKLVLSYFDSRHFQKYIVKSNTALNPTNSNAEYIINELLLKHKLVLVVF